MYRSSLSTARTIAQRGFTLVEMMVVAPIVILLIGAFIALIVNLTGEVLSSRGSNVLAYDIQDALNRIDEDIKLSTGFLAVNNISVASSKQGYGSDTSLGSTVNFKNIAVSGGAPASLIINGLVTNENPMLPTTGLVYLANQPNACTDPNEYVKNRPMTMNIVYFVGPDDALWRRTIMPDNYSNPAVRCGAAEAWQQPSCLKGYNAATLTFCKTTDVKLIDDVTPAGFTFAYTTSASSTTTDTTANNPAVTTDSIRNTALQSTPTAVIDINVTKTVAGRDVSRSGTIRSTRLDTNASSIAYEIPPTTAPSAPFVSSAVSEGRNVTFTWPRVSGATSYDLQYRINGGAWQSNASTTDIGNNSRAYTVSTADHTDTVEAQVRATNSFGNSSYTSNSIVIPLWAPLILKNGWTDYAQGYGTAAYTRTKSGLVMLRGLVRNPGTPAINTVIASLPDDYKPSARLLFGTSTNPNTSARIDITSNADSADVIFSDNGSAPWISLDTIRYIPANTTNTKVVPALQNGFIAYGSGYEGPSYTQSSVSQRVTIQGLLNNGTRTNGTVIFTIPAALRPSLYQHHPSRSGTFHHLGLDVNSGLVAKGDGSGAYSINTSYLPSSVTGWTNLTLVNGWVWYDSGGTYSTPQYVKTAGDNVVQLKGLIRSGSTTYDSVIATLPAGFRPKYRIVSTVPNTAGYARIDILPNGEIHFLGSSNGWLALDNIFFPQEQ